MNDKLRLPVDLPYNPHEDERLFHQPPKEKAALLVDASETAPQLPYFGRGVLIVPTAEDQYQAIHLEPHDDGTEILKIKRNSEIVGYISGKEFPIGTSISVDGSHPITFNSASICAIKLDGGQPALVLVPSREDTYDAERWASSPDAPDQTS